MADPPFIPSEPARGLHIPPPPPHSSIWRDRMDGAWCSHYPPLPRLSRSWKRYGETEALRLCLLDLWQKHCMVHGIALSDCPLEGLLDSEASLQVGGGESQAGAAASSRRR